MEQAMPYIRVVYRTKDHNFDYVPSGMLDTLIWKDEISHFYRPSEKRWVDVKCDPIRGRGGRYQGPERRRIGNNPKSGGEKTGKGIPNTPSERANWLHGLWQDIENL
jgi:hypothetical protein